MGNNISHAHDEDDDFIATLFALSDEDFQEELDSLDITQQNHSLVTAIHKGDKKRVLYLLEAGANMNFQDPELGCTPLHWAGYEGHQDIVQLLIDHGAELNARDKFGRTSLHRACEKSHLDIVKTLILSGARADILDNKGKLPYERATDRDILFLMENHNMDVKPSSSMKSNNSFYSLQDIFMEKDIPVRE